MAKPPDRGWVKIIDDEDALGHAVNWNVLMLARLGQKCRVSKVFDDGTFLATFESGDRRPQYLPWAAVDSQLTSYQMPPVLHVDPVRIGRVRLLGDKDLFRHAFARFENCLTNGFTVEKLQYLGQECRVSGSYTYDNTFVGVFGAAFVTLPWETVEVQLKVF
mmetsp:Transcript_58055/g.92248  ORF Transcript_58055/g.92248 Transcript_58055/m.92248 type:complete len:162 (+) Transcript_58055:67-552(+)